MGTCKDGIKPGHTGRALEGTAGIGLGGVGADLITGGIGAGILGIVLGCIFWLIVLPISTILMSSIFSIECSALISPYKAVYFDKTWYSFDNPVIIISSVILFMKLPIIILPLHPQSYTHPV